MEYKRVTQDSAHMRNNDATIPRCQCLSHNLVVTAGSSNCFIDDSFWECLLLVAVFQMLRFIFLCSYLESVYFTSVDLEILDLKPRRKHLKEFSAFLCMGRWESQGSLKLFPWYEVGKNDAKAETPVLWPPHAKS